MKIRIVASLLAVVAASASGCRCDRDREPPPSNAPAPRPAATVSLPASLERAKVPAIAYGIVTRDKAVAFDAAGLADGPKKIDATKDTIFEAASIGKTIIGVSVMQLVEQKRLDLDADVSTYVGFAVKPPGAKVPVTLRHLLSHRGSIVDHVDQLQDARDKATLGDFLRRYLVQEDAYASTAPGAKVVYSNVGSALAAYAVEKVSGVAAGVAAGVSSLRKNRSASTAFDDFKDAARRRESDLAEDLRGVKTPGTAPKPEPTPYPPPQPKPDPWPKPEPTPKPPPAPVPPEEAAADATTGDRPTDADR